MNWTQPICAHCYGERHPDRTPVRLVETRVERCCLCAAVTAEGIYVRIDPTTVPFPDIREEG